MKEVPQKKISIYEDEHYAPATESQITGIKDGIIDWTIIRHYEDRAETLVALTSERNVWICSVTYEQWLSLYENNCKQK